MDLFWNRDVIKGMLAAGLSAAFSELSLNFS